MLGFNQMLGYMVQDLTHKEKTIEAKGIFIRNNLERYVRKDIKEVLKDVVYDEEKDTSLNKDDPLGPLTKPIEE